MAIALGQGPVARGRPAHVLLGQRDRRLERGSGFIVAASDRKDLAQPVMALGIGPGARERAARGRLCRLPVTFRREDLGQLGTQFGGGRRAPLVFPPDGHQRLPTESLHSCRQIVEGETSPRRLLGRAQTPEPP